MKTIKLFELKQIAKRLDQMLANDELELSSLAGEAIDELHTDLLEVLEGVEISKTKGM